MTPEAQRIAIAKACGWFSGRYAVGARTNQLGWFNGRKYAWNDTYLPDYLNDLNAMHEAEKTLTDDQYQIFMDKLRDASYEAIKDVRPMVKYFRAYSATAAQRAKAFIRTLDLWDDTK